MLPAHFVCGRTPAICCMVNFMPLRFRKQLKSKWIFQIVLPAAFFLICCCLLYNVYTLFFQISLELESDAAEHLHSAYLLSVGERPYLDFIQNHPMLFHHFLVWAEKAFNLTTTRDLATVGRTVIFGHFIICLLVFFFWTTRILKSRPKGIIWLFLLTTSWAMVDIYNPGFYWMWELRPDFICYGQTLLGLFFIYLWLEKQEKGPSIRPLLYGIAGGCLIGFGNSVLPKGIPFIGAFALTLLTATFLAGRNTFSSWMNRKFLFSAAAIGIAICLSFIAGMILDCHLSDVPVQKWLAAVFQLNSRKHIIFSNTEANPVAPLLETFSIPLSLTLLLIGWIVWELINLDIRNSSRNNHLYIWLFAIFAILINLILPAYSTGVTWNYYFIPSIFSAAAICLMLLLRVRELCIQHLPENSLTLSHGAILLLIAFIVVQVLNVPFHAITQVGARKAAAREVAEISPDNFIINNTLPGDFVYLGYPDQIPTKSRNWGYYFMLTRATNFWKDCYSLGLGPDPQKAWGDGFGENPPDAITFTTPEALSEFIFLARKCQQVDVSWIIDEIQARYTLMGCRQATIYARNDKVTYLESIGWKKVADKKWTITTPLLWDLSNVAPEP